MSLMLRSATFSDALVFERIFLSHLEQMVTDAGSPARERLRTQHTAQQFLSRLQQGWLGIVVEQQDRVAGFLMLRPPTHLFSLYVAAEQVGSGIGTVLLQALFEQMPQSVITVNSSVRAETFYRRHGFEPSDTWQINDGLRYLPMQRPLR